MPPHCGDAPWGVSEAVPSATQFQTSRGHTTANGNGVAASLMIALGVGLRLSLEPLVTSARWRFVTADAES